MSPEAAAYLDKSRTTLAEADIMLGVDLFGPAGRAAYLAAFHTAQALISERLGKSAKTHKGVQTLFHDLTKSDPDLPVELRRFVSAAYDMKTMVDYEVGEDCEILQGQAELAVALAHRFVAYFAKALEA